MHVLGKTNAKVLKVINDCRKMIFKLIKSLNCERNVENSVKIKARPKELSTCGIKLDRT